MWIPFAIHTGGWGLACHDFHQTLTFLNLYKINNILGKIEKYKNLCKMANPFIK